MSSGVPSLLELSLERAVTAIAFDTHAIDAFDWRRLPRVLVRRLAALVDGFGIAAPNNVAVLDRLFRRDDDATGSRLSVALSARLDADALARLVLPRAATISALDLSHCTFLGDDESAAESTLLSVSDRLTELHMSGVHLALAQCSCQFAHLRSLDVSACRSLVSLAALCLATTQLESLVVAKTLGVTDDDFVAVLPSAHSLRRLVAKDCTALTFSFMLDCTFPALTELSTAGCFMLTDATLAAIVRHCRQLERLDISQCNQVTQESVLAIRELQHLRHLSVAWCGVADLTPLRGNQLRTLDASWCALLSEPGNGVNSLAQFVSTLVCVQSLKLSFTSVVDDDVVRAILTSCRALVTLALDGCNSVTADAFSGLRFPSTLASLSMYSVPFPLEALHHLAVTSPRIEHLNVGAVKSDCMSVTMFQQLVRLELSHCDSAGDALLDQLWRHCANVGILMLDSTKVTDIGCRQSIPRMHKLRMLGVGSTALSDAAFELLPTTLVDLMLPNVSAVTDAAVFSVVSRLRLLRSLNFSQCPRLTLAAVDATSRLSMLTALSTSYSHVFGRGERPARLSRTLRSLRMAACAELTDQLLVGLLQQTPALDLLDVSYNAQVTKASLDAIWMFVPKLSTLHCRNCSQMQEADLDELRKSMPNVTIW